jgi:hypothetical protein
MFIFYIIISDHLNNILIENFLINTNFLINVSISFFWWNYLYTFYLTLSCYYLVLMILHNTVCLSCFISHKYLHFEDNCTYHLATACFGVAWLLPISGANSSHRESDTLVPFLPITIYIWSSSTAMLFQILWLFLCFFLLLLLNSD